MATPKVRTTSRGQTVIYDPKSKKNVLLTSERGKAAAQASGFSQRDLSGKSTVGFGNKAIATPDKLTRGVVSSNILSQKQLADERTPSKKGKTTRSNFKGGTKAGSLTPTGSILGRASAAAGVQAGQGRSGLGTIGGAGQEQRFDPPGTMTGGVAQTLPGGGLLEGQIDPRLAAEGDLVAAAQGQKEFIGESITPTTFEGIVAQQKARQLQTREAQEAGIGRAQEQFDITSDQQGRSVRGAFDAAETQLVGGGREGMVSAGNVLATQRLKGILGERIRTIQIQREGLNAEVDELRTNLKRAQDANNAQLAQDIQATIAAKELEIRDSDTRYINSLTAASEEERMQAAAERESLSTFTGLVDEGMVLDTEGIMHFANKLGVDFQVAYDYYQGSQAIRDDKSLSLEEKKIQNAQNLQNLNDQITGRDIDAIKKVDFFTNYIKEGGKTEEEISTMKELLGITDKDDPLYQAELRTQQLENDIKQYEVDNQGSPPPEGTVDRLDYDIKQLELIKEQKELADLMGYDNELTVEQASDVFHIDGHSKYHVGEDGTPAEGWEVGTNTWECGEAYNKITDGARVGSDYSTKLDQTKGADGKPRQDAPQIGNGLVIPIGSADYGHIETVVNVNPITNTFQTVSWNRNLDGKQTVHTYNLDQMESKFGENWGFTDSTLKPEYEKSLVTSGAPTGGDSKYSYDSFYEEAKKSGMSDENAEKVAYNQYKDSQSFAREQESDSYYQYSKMAPEEASYKQITANMTDDELTEYADNNGYFTKQLATYSADDQLTAQIVNEIFTDDQERQLFLTQARWVGGKLRGESGAAISVGEYLQEGQQFWPQKGDDAATIKSKEDARNNIMNGLYNISGLHGQKLIDEGAAEQEVDSEQEELDAMMELYENSALLDEFDEAWGE